MKILSNLFTPKSPGVRVETFFLHTQTPSWSMIHTAMSGMLVNTLGSQTMMTLATMAVWSHSLLTLLLIIMGLWNKQNMRHSSKNKFVKSTQRHLWNSLKNLFFHILWIVIPSLTLPRTPLTYWVTWYSTMVLSPLFLCNQSLLWILRTGKQISRILVSTLVKILYQLILLNQVWASSRACNWQPAQVRSCGISVQVIKGRWIYHV